MNSTNKYNEESGLFRSIIAASPDIVYAYNLKWSTFIYVNDRINSLLGYTEYELKDMGDAALKTIMHPDDLKTYQDEILPNYFRLKGNTPLTYNARYIHKNGKVKHFSCRDVVFDRKDDGTARMILGVMQDITQQIESKKKIEESEKKFRKLFDNAPVGMYLSNKDGSLQYANSALLNMLGYDSIAEIQESKNDKKIYVNQDDFRRFRGIILDEGTIYNFETEMFKKDGSIITVRESAHQINNNETGETFFEGIVHDITEEKKSIEEIEKLSKAVKEAPISVVITDKNGEIEFVNSMFTKVSGYSAKDAIGQNPRLLKSGKQSDEFYKKMWDTISSGKIWEGEFYNKKKNGELYWEKAHISPIKNYKGEIKHYVALKEDVTEKKLMLDELIVAKEEAEKSDKLKSEFLAQVSHEIRTPLNSLIGFSSYLSEVLYDDLDEDLRISFDSIKKSGNRIIRTFDLILNMSQIQSNSYDAKMKVLDLADEVVNPVVASIKRKLNGDNLSVTTHFPDSPVFIKGDQYSLEQIITNICDNAVKFTMEGSVDLSLHLDNQNYAVLKIKDTGIGIDEEFLPKIFDIFSQEEQGYTRSFDGNGLGLSLVKEYCKLNNIDITIESKKKKGTNVTLKFNNTIPSDAKVEAEEDIHFKIGS